MISMNYNLSDNIQFQCKNKIYTNIYTTTMNTNIKYTTNVIMPYGNRVPFESTLKNFKKLVKDITKGYSIYYTDQDNVKPFFDIDLKVNKKINEKELLNNCLDLIKNTFNDAEISVASYHRYIDNEQYKDLPQSLYIYIIYLF